eukprot:NODE_198_length_15297_cov_0.486182.p7 type:complete len:279 gc:universal NODE_198_length_15297_cov_0.486182:12474-13310(+)
MGFNQTVEDEKRKENKFGNRLDSPMSISDTNTRKLKADIPDPEMIRIEYSYIILAVILFIFLLLLMFKARHRIKSWICKPKRTLFKRAVKRKSSVHQNPLLMNSYLDAISCDSFPDDYSNLMRLRTEPSKLDVIASRESSIVIPFDTPLQSDSKCSVSNFSSSPISSEISESILSVHKEPPFVERAMKMSKRFSRRLLPSFFFKEPRESLKYFHEESQIYSLEHSENQTNSSILSESVLEETIPVIYHETATNSIISNDTSNKNVDETSIMICFAPLN